MYPLINNTWTSTKKELVWLQTSLAMKHNRMFAMDLCILHVANSTKWGMSHHCSSPYSFEMVSTQFLFCVNIQFDSSKQNGRNINPPAKRFHMEMNTHEKYSYENIYMCCFVCWKCSFACVYSHRFKFVHNEECDNKQHVLLYSLVQTFLALFLTRPLRVEWNSISSSLFYINFHWFFRFLKTNSVFSSDPCKYLSDWFPV